MTLNGVSLNQPAYGYLCEVYTGVKWNYVADNWRGYNTGFVYFKNSMNLLLDETMQSTYTMDFSAPMTLALSTGHGFYPYSPIFSDTSYSVSILNYGYSGLKKSPWLYSETKIDSIYKPTEIPVFSYVELPTEGTFSMWSGNGGRVDMVPGIREIDQPPNITMPNYYNVALTQSGDSYAIIKRLPSQENCSIVSTINITGSASKIRQILLYLLAVGTGHFYFCAPDNYYNGDPGPDTMNPDFWLFGRKIPMNKYGPEVTLNSTRFYGWKVKCINNPITITHDNLRHFTITLKLALVV